MLLSFTAGENMSSIKILHLSDLHISSKKLSATSRKLIEDIVKQTQQMDEIVLVVTGDIVDKGEYSKYAEGVVRFFTELKGQMGEKIKETFFVPGNHDKELSISNTLYGKLSQTSDFVITEDIWKLQEQNYKSYVELITKVKKIFKPKSKKVTETFGVEVCEVEDNVLCFVKIDTSWGTYGEKGEEGKLVVGDYQLNSLIHEYESIRDNLEEQGKQISITIGIGHHPITWLNPVQEKKMKKYMIDEEYFNMNLYLCGHIHDMELENWYNNERSIMTLVTGIGWNHRKEDDSEKDKKDGHRYSIYLIDVFKNSCDIIMRRSKKSGSFITDYSVYDDKVKSGKLCYPLKIENGNQPFIDMNSPKDDLTTSIFVDEKMMSVIKNSHASMVFFQKKAVELSMFYKRNYIERQADIYQDEEEYQKIVTLLNNRFFMNDYTDDNVKNVFMKKIDIVYQNFMAFLQDVSANFVNNFQDSFPEHTNLRVHFRWYKKEEDKYRKLCQYSNVDLGVGPSISEIDWGGLIEQAYILDKSMIYSVNPRHNNHEPVKWDDFMTIVPSFFKSEQELRNSQNKKIKRPSMTFGISVLNNECNKEELSKSLYVFEYLGIDKLISSIIDDYIRDFNVDYSHFLAYIDRILNKGEELNEK